MNSYWVVHASDQKITKTTKSLKNLLLRLHFKIVSRQIEMIRQQRMGRPRSGVNLWKSFTVPKTRVFQAANGEDLVILVCTVFH